MPNRDISRDVQEALTVRDEMVTRAEKDWPESRSAAIQRSVREIRSSPIFVWEPRGMASFWAFWASRANTHRFIDAFFEKGGLKYVEELCSPGFHFFPVPGTLFGDDMLPEPYRDAVASFILPPTTRAIAMGSRVDQGKRWIPSLIQTVHVDPSKLIPGPNEPMPRLTPLKEMPPKGTKEAQLLQLTEEVKFLEIRNGIVCDKKPIDWLVNLYKLRIFLEQPFVGVIRHHEKRNKKNGPKLPEPTPEILEVLMREPIPVKIPRFVIPAVSQVTGRKLDYEVDVASHIRICASGKAVRVKAHKRGPKGVRREKVIKIVR